MYLFMFYVGGNAGKSNIEVHDIQFVVARTPEAWPALREAWFGDADKIHIDGYSRINWADGYEVTLARTPAHGGVKLFFVNAGGYRSDTTAELHEFGLFAASDAREAKEKALKRCCAAPGSNIGQSAGRRRLSAAGQRWATGIST